MTNEQIAAYAAGAPCPHVDVMAMAAEIELLRDQRDTNLAKEVETVGRLEAEIERLKKLMDGKTFVTSPEPGLVQRVCHALTDQCVMFTDPERQPCTPANCAAMRAAAEPASREAFDGLHKAGCAALELPHGRRSHCNCGAVKSTVLPACECLILDKEPSAYHNAKCPRFVEGKL